MFYSSDFDRIVNLIIIVFLVFSSFFLFANIKFLITWDKFIDLWDFILLFFFSFIVVLSFGLLCKIFWLAYLNVLQHLSPFSVAIGTLSFLYTNIQKIHFYRSEKNCLYRQIPYIGIFKTAYIGKNPYIGRKKLRISTNSLYREFSKIPISTNCRYGFWHYLWSS